MIFCELYETPADFDPLLLSGDGRALTAIDFLRIAPATPPAAPGTYPFFEPARQWLDAYFTHRPLPEFPPVSLESVSPFGQQVLKLLLQIPYGQLTTYGALSKQIAQQRHLSRMSAQAVGGAVGRNPICIMIPCHRVIGTNGSLTGFGGGMKNKVALLRHEGIDLDRYTIPIKGTRL